jgi:hypothetical protein
MKTRLFGSAITIIGMACLLVLFCGKQRNRFWAEASTVEVQEVKPYVFADLPHGRIYKTVHEGCELYIVENDYEAGPGTYNYQHAYAITAGRGCK